MGYKIVMRKLSDVATDSTCKTVRICRKCGLPHPYDEGGRVKTSEIGEISPFSEEELMRAASPFQNGKAPGPDWILGEIMKAASAHSCF